MGLVTGRRGPGEQKQPGHIHGIILTAAVLSLPSLNGDFSWLHLAVPLPAFYYLSCQGEKQGLTMIATSALAAAVIVTLFGSFPVLLFTLTLLPVGFILAQGARRHENQLTTGLKGIIVLLVGWAVLGVLYGTISHTNPYTEMLQGLDKGIEATYTLYRQSANLPDEVAGELEKAFSQLRLLIARLFPALLLTSVICTVSLNLIIGNWLLKRRRPDLTPWRNFREWKLPESLVWFVIFGVAMMLVPIESLNTTGMNTLLVIGVLYLFQGQAILVFLLDKWAVPHPFRVVIYFVVLLQVYGLLMLAVLGVADIWVDFRKKQLKTPA